MRGPGRNAVENFAHAAHELIYLRTLRTLLAGAHGICSGARMARPRKKKDAPDAAEMFPVTAKVPGYVFEKLEARRRQVSASLAINVSMAAAVRSALIQWAETH